MGKLFNFFSGTNNRTGKGVSKKQAEHDKKLGFVYFFKLLKSKLGKFSGTNLIFSLCNIFLFIALFGLSGILDDSVATAANPLYAQINNVYMNESSPFIAALYSVYCASTGLRMVSVVSKILMCSVFALLFTFGLSTIGVVYNMRNVCTGEHVDTWHDFFYAIKRNFRQGIIIGTIDTIVIFLLVYDLVVYGASSGNTYMMLIFYYAVILFSAVYYIMRFYIYIQLVTCEMSIWKIFKNSFLLTALGFKRNLVGLIGTVLFALLFVYAWILLPQFAIILIAIFVYTFMMYIGVYCAYPVVKKYVIDPYYEDHPEELVQDDDDSEEQVFIDREQ